MGDGEDDGASLPLRGAILCCTAIAPEQRTAITEVAQEMGAIHKYDLTSDVTHLIVGGIDTAKYKYVAKERPDVKAVTYDWIEALREAWKAGGDIDVEALEERHRVPAFSGLRICLTGFEDLADRQAIQELVSKNGAQYDPDLTKAVTHLIAAAPQGKKYEYARNWKIKIVAMEWLEDSVKRGMVLDEDLYSPTIPQEERGRGAFKTTRKDSAALGKRPRETEAPQKAADGSRRKLRRTASAKLGSQQDGLWADITAARSESQIAQEEQWDDATSQANDPNTSKTDELEPRSSRTTQESESRRHSSGLELSTSILKPKLPASIFDNMHMHIHGFDAKKSAILSNALLTNGATVVEATAIESQSDRSEVLVVVPHDIGGERLAELPEALDKVDKVNEWWVEKCLHGKSIIDYTSSALYQPFRRTKIAGFPNLSISSTGFSGVDLLHLTKVVKLLGATYDEFLKQDCSVLLCNRDILPNEKVLFANDNDIPTVSIKWLLDCIASGEFVPFDQYRNRSARAASHAQAAPPQRSSSKQAFKQPRPSDRKNWRRSQPLELTTSANLARTFDGSSSAKSTTSRRAGSTSRTATPTLTTTAAERSAPSASPPKPRSQPLAEIGPNASPRRSQPEPTLSQPEPKLSQQGPEPDIENQPDAESTAGDEDAARATLLNESIAELLAQKQLAASRPSSNSAPLDRRKRTLGRAPSNPSSLHNSHHSLGPLDRPVSADGIDLVSIEEPLASQALGYEDPETARMRERMIRAMGGKVLDDGGVRVQSVGLVRDSALVTAEASSGMGKRKGRDKGRKVVR